MPSVKDFGFKSFFYSASKLWNSLSPNLQYITNKPLFKKNVTAYLREKLLAVDQGDYIYFLFNHSFECGLIYYYFDKIHNFTCNIVLLDLFK